MDLGDPILSTSLHSKLTGKSAVHLLSFFLMFRWKGLRNTTRPRDFNEQVRGK